MRFYVLVLCFPGQPAASSTVIFLKHRWDHVSFLPQTQSSEHTVHTSCLGQWNPLEFGLSIFPHHTYVGNLSGTLQKHPIPMAVTRFCSSVCLFLLPASPRMLPIPPQNPLVQETSSHLRALPSEQFCNYSRKQWSCSSCVHTRNSTVVFFLHFLACV